MGRKAKERIEKITVPDVKDIKNQRQQNTYKKEDWVSSMDTLGSRMNPPRSRNVIKLAIRKPGNPGRRQNNCYNVPEWQKWFDDSKAEIEYIQKDANGGERSTNVLDEKKSLELEKLRLYNSAKKFENEQALGRVNDIEETTQVISSLFLEFASTLRSSEDTMASRVVGAESMGAAKKIIHQEIRSAFEKMAIPSAFIPRIYFTKYLA